jgi:hypothetical protein
VRNCRQSALLPLGSDINIVLCYLAARQPVATFTAQLTLSILKMPHMPNGNLRKLIQIDLSEKKLNELRKG